MKMTREERLERKRLMAERVEAELSGYAQKFMRLAIKQARVAERKGEVPIGAVIVKDGRVIARGHNKRESKRLATAHAEIFAINAACARLGDWRLNGCDIFVTLEPCTMCAGAIANARISRVFFGAYEKKGGACGSARDVLSDTGLNANVWVRGGVLESECSALITEFFENKRNKINDSH